MKLVSLPVHLVTADLNRATDDVTVSVDADLVADTIHDSRNVNVLRFTGVRLVQVEVELGSEQVSDIALVFCVTSHGSSFHRLRGTGLHFNLSPFDIMG